MRVSLAACAAIISLTVPLVGCSTTSMSSVWQKLSFKSNKSAPPSSSSSLANAPPAPSFNSAPSASANNSYAGTNSGATNPYAGTGEFWQFGARAQNNVYPGTTYPVTPYPSSSLPNNMAANPPAYSAYPAEGASGGQPTNPYANPYATAGNAAPQYAPQNPQYAPQNPPYNPPAPPAESYNAANSAGTMNR